MNRLRLMCVVCVLLEAGVRESALYNFHTKPPFYCLLFIEPPLWSLLGAASAN
jgi:hypothetical protein